MTVLTLNQTIELLKRFAYLHMALGRNENNDHFFYGDSWELGASTSPKFALMHLVLDSTTKEGNLITRNFKVEFSDLVNKDENNELHVQSDTEQMCFDLLIYLENIQDDGDLGITISKTSNLQPFTEEGDDERTGWGFDFSITGHVGNLSCALPIVPGNYFENNYIFVGGASAGSFTVEIKDQDGNVLQTFTTSGEYVVEVLNRVRDTITANTATIIDPIV